MGTMEDHSGKAKQTDKDNRNYSFTAHRIAAKPMGNPPDASPNRSPCFRPFTSIIASDYYYYYHHHHSCYYYYYYTAAVTTVTDVATAEGKNSEGPKSIGEGNLITEKSLAFVSDQSSRSDHHGECTNGYQKTRSLSEPHS